METTFDNVLLFEQNVKYPDHNNPHRVSSKSTIKLLKAIISLNTTT